MINLIDIKWKNFLSYGNTLETFVFKKGVNRIIGINGSGKSSLVEIINFALFGRPYRKVKLPQLVNSKNKKDLYVELNFTKGEDVYRIERGIKPEIFRIFKNEEIVPVASSKRGYQQILEEDIIHSNENLFNQIGIKSLTKNLSFMGLSKNEKRNVVENIFDIELFTTMLKIIKSKVEATDFSISSIKKDISNTELLIEHEILNLDNLKKIQLKIEEESKIKVEELKEELYNIEQETKKYNVALDKINKNKKVKQNKLNEIELERRKIKIIRDRISTIQADIKLSVNKIKMFDEVCHGCSKIKELLVSENVESLQKEYKQCELDIEEIRSIITTKEVEIRRLDEILANEKFINGNIQRNTKRVAEINASVNIEVSREIDIDESKLKEQRKRVKELQAKYIKIGEQKKHFLILKSLFSDDGIKAFIIKKYLPTINKLLNSYLLKFNSDIIFNFDTEFNEIVLTRHKEDFSYFSFSEGQKARINLAVMFSFINFSIYKNKKANINVLVLDEILAGLDASGKQGLHTVLKEFTEQHQKSIITINHETELDPDNFDYIYEVKMNKGFSDMKEIEL